jgi:predicted metal-dependent hydrolase
MKKTFFLRCLLLVTVINILLGCSDKRNNKTLIVDKSAPEKLNSRVLKEWQQMKFGLFIHWGVYSIPAGVWQGKQVGS